MNSERPPRRVIPEESIEEGKHTAEHGDEVYDVYKLIHLAEPLPEEMVSTVSLENHKEGNYWHDTNGEWVGPHHILALAESHRGSLDWEALKKTHPHLKKILTKIQFADLSYPILIAGDGIVIDGMHRLTKAWIEGKTEIKAKKFSSLPEESILKKY